MTADGSFLTASQHENPELFWGLRGGGGNFGVATSFEYRLHPLSTVYGGMLVFPFSMAPAVLKCYTEVAATAPDDLMLVAALMPTPDGGKAAGVVVCCTAGEEEGRRLIHPLRDLGPVADQVATIPYTAQQRILDPVYPPGLRSYWKSSFLNGIDEALLEMLIRETADAPAMSHVVIEQFGGAVARVAEDATPFGTRAAPFNLLILGLSPDPASDDAIRERSRGVWNLAQRRSAGGSYVNYLNSDDNAGAAYSVGTMARLAALKKQYDPGNLFRLNQNIPPA